MRDSGVRGIDRVDPFKDFHHGLLGDDTSFLEEGIIDSTGVLELVAHLQEHYGITVEDSELTPDNLDSINSISEFIGRKQQVSPEPTIAG